MTKSLRTTREEEEKSAAAFAFCRTCPSGFLRQQRTLFEQLPPAASLRRKPQTYRSVAYGTWRVGSARKFCEPLTTITTRSNAKNNNNSKFRRSSTLKERASSTRDSCDTLMSLATDGEIAVVAPKSRDSGAYSQDEDEQQQETAGPRVVRQVSSTSSSAGDNFSAGDYLQFHSKECDNGDEHGLNQDEWARRQASKEELEESVRSVARSFHELGCYCSNTMPKSPSSSSKFSSVKRRCLFYGTCGPQLGHVEQQADGQLGGGGVPFGHKRSKSAGSAGFFSVLHSSPPAKAISGVAGDKNNNSNNSKHHESLTTGRVGNATKKFLRRLYAVSNGCRKEQPQHQQQQQQQTNSSRQRVVAGVRHCATLTTSDADNLLLSPNRRRDVAQQSYREIVDYLREEFTKMRHKDMRILENLRTVEKDLHGLKRSEDMADKPLEHTMRIYDPSPISEVPSTMEID